MKPGRLLTILPLALIALGILTTAVSRRTARDKSPAASESLRAALPEARTLRPTADPALQDALNNSGRVIGHILSTRGLTDDIKGYGGPIALIIGITPEGTIRNIVLADHQETPGFTSRISSLLDQFRGQNIRTRFTAGDTIDAISGATITSHAIIATVNAALERAAPSLPAQALPRGVLPPARVPVPVSSIAVTGIFLLVWQACRRRRRLLWWAGLMAGFTVLGLITRAMLSTAHAAGLALFQFPAWTRDPVWHVLMAGAILSSLTAGRLYCAGVCPFAFVEEFLYAVNRRWLRAVMSPDQKTDAACRSVKYILLTALIAVSLILGRSGISALEPYITLFTAGGSWPAWILLALVLTGSFFFLRFWCRYLCPFGAFLAALTSLRPRTTPLDADPCFERAECFYCAPCVRRQTPDASGKKHTLIFSIFISATLAVFLWSAVSAIRTVTHHPGDGEPKTLAGVATSAYHDDTSTVKKTLRDAGIIPRPAQYWRVLNHE